MTFRRDDTFSFRLSKSGEVTVFHLGQPVTVLRGQAADRFVRRMKDAPGPGGQQLMARVTGNFKRGNEKAALRK